MDILASALATKESGGSGEHEPIAWAIPYGEGRVFTTVLGHHWRGQEDFDSLHCVGFQTLVARAAEWTATGAVTLPIPKQFPKSSDPAILKPEDIVWHE
jgi:type 1 glutamine amidotransferase